MEITIAIVINIIGVINFLISSNKFDDKIFLFKRKWIVMYPNANKARLKTIKDVKLDIDQPNKILIIKLVKPIIISILKFNLSK